MALLSHFTILPQDFLYPSGPLLSQLTSATIIEAKTKTCQKRGEYLKLEVMMRASVHACIHRLVVQLRHLVSGEIEKSCMLCPLLP